MTENVSISSSTTTRSPEGHIETKPLGKTANARLQQRIYNRAKRRAYDAVVHHSPENEALFRQYLVQFQSDLEYEAGYTPAPRGGRRSSSDNQ